MGDRLATVYFGTPAIAVPALEALAGDERFEVRLVVTQPDRPAGRGRRLAPPPVKLAAERLGLPVYQPEGLRPASARVPLEQARADLFVVLAFGMVFGRATLAIPRLGCLNLHASLLPKYRGASPIAAAILRGDERTGVTLMRMDPGLDTGPMLATSALDISPQDTADSLGARLGEVAARLAVAEIPRYAWGELSPWPQPTAGASLTRLLTRADGWLDWSRTADELERRVRAMWPWPRAWTTVGGDPLQVHAAAVVSELPDAAPGTVLSARGDFGVAGGAGALRLVTVLPAGGRPFAGAALAAGRNVTAGERLGAVGGPTEQPPLVVPVAPPAAEGG
jgi:methionyl-tRNA formyltransferase